MNVVTNEENRFRPPSMKSQRKERLVKHMVKKRINTVNVALDEADKRIAGVTAHGAAIGLVNTTAAAITQDCDDLIAARNAVGACNVDLKGKYAVVRSVSKTADRFVKLSREYLKQAIGPEYSSDPTGWTTAGFIGSLRIPRSVTGMKGILNQLNAYYTANPTQEVTDGNVTAVRAKALYDQLSAAQAAVVVQETTTRNASRNRDEKFKALCKRMSNLGLELAQKLGPLDTRYLAFGLPLPGAKATPDVPTNIIAALVGPNAIAVKWDKAARAEYYRVWWKVKNAEGDPIAAGSRAELDITLEGLPSNSFIEISVSAVNNGGESLKSTVVTVQTAA